MKSRVISATLSLVVSFLLSSISYAACSGTSVNSFGLEATGSPMIQVQSKAINSVAAAGGGNVVFSVARYKTTGTFNIPTGVVLCGAIEGPFDVVSTNLANNTVAPTLLITNTVNPLVPLSKSGDYERLCANPLSVHDSSNSGRSKGRTLHSNKCIPVLGR
jgi:hypothetical protein